MNRTKLKNYAPQARRDFIQAVTDRAAVFGLTKATTEPITQRGDVAIIGGRTFPTAIAERRRRLEDRINRLTSAGKTPAEAFAQVMEATAYTWFNRLVAIRYMEIHGYLDHGFRVLSHKDPAKATPEILEHAESVVLPGLDTEAVINLKLDGTKEPELYRMLLIAQCNALSSAMPFLFERIDDETELLLPDNLLNSDSLIGKLVTEIDEADWQEVEIIGWLYQFYISDKMRDVIGKVVKSEDIPAATQLFTPNWVVKYLVQNTLGRKWLSTYPASPLRQKMAFYIEPAEQTPEVQAQLAAITPASLNPEELTMIDPACGSGHILVEGYDLLKEIYLERGYRLRDIPKLILSKNLFGLEIDDRAAQLAAFALMMKARADDRRLFDAPVPTNVVAVHESNGLNVNAIVQAFTDKKITNEEDLKSGEFEFMNTVRAPLFEVTNAPEATADTLVSDLKLLFSTFLHAKTYGSLLTIPPSLAERLPAIAQAVTLTAHEGHLGVRYAAGIAGAFTTLASFLSRRFDFAIANPPYMGNQYFAQRLKEFVSETYNEAKADLYACFIRRNTAFAKVGGFVGMITIPNWMFLSSFEDVRRSIFERQHIDTFIHNGRGVFGSDFGSCSFTLRNVPLPLYRASYRRLFEKQGSVSSNEELAERFRAATTINSCISEFLTIPSIPVAYWIKGLHNFSKGAISLSAESGGRFKTHDDAKYVRFWWEVHAFSGYWKRYLKGGEFRKFYGNEYHVADWRQSALDVYESHGGLANPRFRERDGITCSKITASSSSFRLKRANCEYSSVSPTIFARDPRTLQILLSFLNSKVAAYYLAALNPSITTNVTDILSEPDPTRILSEPSLAVVASNAIELIALAQHDWDSAEISPDFQTLPILVQKASTAAKSQELADADILKRIGRSAELEHENNRLFIDGYGLQDELTAEIPEDHITIRKPDRVAEMRRLVSFALGCAMGRYSLDKPGLIYANSGNEGFDATQYKTFFADADGIIPITEFDWFEDAAARRLEQFIAVAWPKEHLDENLKFIAESLGLKSGEQPRDTIRRYLADGFYKDHLQTYKRRPVYWMFTSGRLGAFQCLVYLHRYNEGTLARMRTEYVIPLQGKMNARIDQLEGDKNKAAPTHKKRLEKELELLKRQQAELIKFDEKLRHYADMRIRLDLDDGVAANYQKLVDLLHTIGTKSDDARGGVASDEGEGDEHE